MPVLYGLTKRNKEIHAVYHRTIADIKRSMGRRVSHANYRYGSGGCKVGVWGEHRPSGNWSAGIGPDVFEMDDSGVSVEASRGVGPVEYEKPITRITQFKIASAHHSTSEENVVRSPVPLMEVDGTEPE